MDIEWNIHSRPDASQGVVLDREFLLREVYTVPLRGNTLVYAPLTRYVALYEGKVDLSNVDFEWLEEAVNPANVPGFIKERGFAYDTDKIRLRLNITSRCNLACKYCSVKALCQGSDMPISTAYSAVTGFVSRAKKIGSKELEIVFSGGEPTLRFDCIEEIIRFARKETSGTGLRLSIRILTNGLFKRRIVARFADLFQEVQISWDGSLANNPRYGSNSRIPRKVWNNLLGLLGAGVSVSVLTVVSAENYLYLRRIVDELYAAGVKHIFLAIEDALGRSAERDTKINYIALEEIYLGLWRDYRAKGIEINLTGTDIHSISPFPCSVPIPNYSMAPDGKISACTIAFNDSDAHAKLFQIGALENGHVSIDNARVLSVREYSVLNMENCRACFAKWHCRGGCPYSKCRRWPYPLTPERCALVRAVVADKVYTTAQ